MNIIEQYQAELEKDMHVDELNVTQVALMLPAIKHKWVARLINAKLKISKLESLKKETREKIFNSKKADASTQHLKLSNIAIDRSIDSDEIFKKNSVKIDEEIEYQKLVVLYLEKIENIFKNMTFDIKNIVDLTKLETT